VSNNDTTPRANFETLPVARRSVFVRRNYGFLRDVADALSERGFPFSRATVTRTWYGAFHKPNPQVVAELELHYQRVVDRIDQRRSRIRRQTAA
jgi:hypothetical protein